MDKSKKNVRSNGHFKNFIFYV